MTWQAWLLVVVTAVFCLAGYRYSLWRHPERDCHYCTGWGRHRGGLFRYAKGKCKGRTLLPPRAQCDGGRVPRYGRRVLRLQDK